MLRKRVVKTMYNLVLKEYLNLKEYKYYSSPIKTDEDRIKPKKKRRAGSEDDFECRYKWVSYNPFTGERLEEGLFLTADVEDEETKYYMSVLSSYRRTRRMIFDLCMSNLWEYFVTFTFAEDKVDRYDYEECSKKMANWINNVKKKFAPDIKYVVVPEQHKDGAWHFHGVFANVGDMTFLDSGRKDKHGRVIYNLYEYKFGFTTATYITDNMATCLYIQKYITKDLCGNLYNKKRYWCSRNLDKPKIEKRMYRNGLEEFENSLVTEDYRSNKVQGEFYDVYQYLIYTTNTD